MVERVEAEDALDARIRELDLPSVVVKKPGFRTIADDRIALEELLRDFQCRFGHVEDDDFAAELSEKARGPSRACAEVEDAQSRRETHPLQHGREVDQDRRRIRNVAERLRQVEVVVFERAEIVLGGAIELVDRTGADQLANVDQRFRGWGGLLRRRRFDGWGGWRRGRTELAPRELQQSAQVLLDRNARFVRCHGSTVANDGTHSVDNERAHSARKNNSPRLLPGVASPSRSRARGAGDREDVSVARYAGLFLMEPRTPG